LVDLIARNEEAVNIVRRALRVAPDSLLANKLGIPFSRGKGSAGPGALTRRESEVLELLCDGLSNAEVAARLFITESTVKVHVHHVLTKLGVKTRVQAVLRVSDALP
jgi:DNA-binding NarL/FixJ family response regulator